MSPARLCARRREDPNHPLPLCLLLLHINRGETKMVLVVALAVVVVLVSGGVDGESGVSVGV